MVRRLRGRQLRRRGVGRRIDGMDGPRDRIRRRGGLVGGDLKGMAQMGELVVRVRSCHCWGQRRRMSCLDLRDGCRMLSKCRVQQKGEHELMSEKTRRKMWKMWMKHSRWSPSWSRLCFCVSTMAFSIVRDSFHACFKRYL